MTRGTYLLLSTSLTSFLLLAQPTYSASIENLGDLPGGIIFGSAFGVSSNGNVIVGYSEGAGGAESFRWASGTGIIGLGDLPGGAFFSLALDASGDGNVVIGQSVSASGTEAFRWTSGTGMVGLGDLAGGIFFSAANGISSDGNVIVGRGTSASGTEAFRWTSGTGMVGIGDLAGGGFASIAYGVSADGNVIVGQGVSASGTEAFRWTSGTGMVGLGDLAGGGFSSIANSANSDGSVIVGNSASASGNEAFRWTQLTGMESLSSILTTAGVDLTGFTLTNARDVDNSGNIIVGEGIFGGNTIAFLANVATGGVTTPDNLAIALSSGIVPVQQAQSTINMGLGQSLFASTLSSAIFRHDGLDAFDNNVSPDSIAPAAGEEDGERLWSAYAVGTFGMGQDNNAENTNLNGTTGLIFKLNNQWTAGLGVIGNSNGSEMAYGGESSLKAAGGSLITAYEGEEGLRFYGSAFAAHLNIDTDRNYLNGAGIDTSNGETSGMGYGIAARGGWEFDVQDTEIMPYAEIHVTWVDIDSYTETGGAFPATYGKSQEFQATSKLGAQIEYDIKPTLTITTRAAWGHRLYKDENGISASTTGFSGTISDTTGDKNWAELAIETGWQATEDTRLRTELSGRSGRIQDPMASLTLGLSTRF